MLCVVLCGARKGYDREAGGSNPPGLLLIPLIPKGKMKGVLVLLHEPYKNARRKRGLFVAMCNQEGET